MSAFSGFYIRANTEATQESIRLTCNKLKLEVEQRGDFIGVKQPQNQMSEEMLTRLSRGFDTEVFWLGFESAMDCFEFHHWQSGRHIRSLVYGMEEERTWERADGKPEPWEAEFLFHPNNLECDLMECAGNEEQRKMLQRVYRQRKVKVGLTGPGISSKETAAAIAQHYGFPHYGLS